MDAQQAAIYLQANPDVAAEFARDNAGMSPEQFASWHYANNGWKEQRVLPQVVNARDYFAANPDVAAAYATGGQGLTPDQFAQAHHDLYVATGKEKRNVAPAEAPRSGYNLDGSQRTSANPNNVAPAIQVTRPDGTTGLISGAQAAADADPGAAYRAKREQEAYDALAPQRAMDAWQAQIDAQPWIRDFDKAPRFGAGPWGYDGRTGKFTNHVNALIDQYGTYDPREYAAKIGIAPPPEWKSDPTKWQRDTSPEPTRSPYQQDIADRQAANAATANLPLAQRNPTPTQTVQTAPAPATPQPSAPEVAPASPKPLISAARLPATTGSPSPITSPVAGVPREQERVVTQRKLEAPKGNTLAGGLIGNWIRG